MFRIRYKGPKGKSMLRLEGDYRRMTNKGAEAVARKLEENLVYNILAYQLFWKGTLVDSVHVEKLSRTQLAVNMAFYAWAKQKGHVIPPGVRLPKLIGWARQTMGVRKASAWINKVFTQGHTVIAKPFISDSMDTIKHQILYIMLANLRKVKSK